MEHFRAGKTRRGKLVFAANLVRLDPGANGNRNGGDHQIAATVQGKIFITTPRSKRGVTCHPEFRRKWTRTKFEE
jgi:hypothetical protein